MSAHDLSGDWQGIFNYPADAPATGFRATLRDVEGVLTGEPIELGLTGGEVAARLQGRREGDAVGFVKLYDVASELYDDVSYRGNVSADGLEIAGRWSILADWSGTFIMVRDAAEPAAVEAEGAAEEGATVR